MKPLSHEEPRRGFLVASINGLMGLITAALALPTAGYLLGGSKTKRPADWVAAGDLAKLEANVPEQVVFERVRRDGWKTVTEKASAWMVKTSEKEVVAFSPVCTHLGCAVSWDGSAKNFACPCHTSSFGTDGKVLAGPAPRALDRFDLKLDGNTILLGDIRPADKA
jgi:menaquinol-cytochrome c reductase iron-sulfur subunit